MISKKLPSDYWASLKEHGSELICSFCKEVIIYEPDQYSEDLIKQIVSDHKGTHFAHQAEDIKQAQSEDIYF